MQFIRAIEKDRKLGLSDWNRWLIEHLAKRKRRNYR
jgi:hypothetical protein